MKNYREVQIERCNWRHPETVHVCGYIRNLRDLLLEQLVTEFLVKLLCNIHHDTCQFSKIVLKQ